MRGDTKVPDRGGGVAALEAALALRALAGDRTDVELLAPEPLFWYRPMSVAEPLGSANALVRPTGAPPPPPGRPTARGPGASTPRGS